MQFANECLQIAPIFLFKYAVGQFRHRVHELPVYRRHIASNYAIAVDEKIGIHLALGVEIGYRQPPLCKGRWLARQDGRIVISLSSYKPSPPLAELPLHKGALFKHAVGQFRHRVHELPVYRRHIASNYAVSVDKKICIYLAVGVEIGYLVGVAHNLLSCVL